MSQRTKSLLLIRGKSLKEEYQGYIGGGRGRHADRTVSSDSHLEIGHAVV